MYFVDLNLLYTRLDYIEKLHQYCSSFRTKPAHLGDRLAFERAVHVIIEAILDVGQQMIDGFMMRDPGSYMDVIHIMGDEQVLSDQDVELLKKLITLRKMLVQEYHQVDGKGLWQGYQQAQEAIPRFCQQIRSYLENEMGPVHAFKQRD